MSLAWFQTVDPHTITTASAIAALTFNRSDLTANITFTQSAAAMLTENAGFTATVLVASGQITLSPATGTTATCDCSLGNQFVIVCPSGGGTVIVAFSNLQPGQSVNVIIAIGAVACTVTLPSGSGPSWKYSNGNKTVPSTISSVHLLSFVYSSAMSTCYASLATNFA